MPALQSCGSWIYVEKIEMAVVLHLKDMAVPADEKLWRAFLQLSDNASVVAAGITAYVCHKNISTFT